MQRLFLIGLWGMACQHPHALPQDATSALHRAADASTTSGVLIYQGTVRHRDTDGPPLYRYERRVLVLDEAVRSSHLTVSPTGGPVLLHLADHSPTYELIGFRETHAQTGLVAELHIGTDGTATYRTTVDRRTRTRIEAPGDPIQVGPTLFGYVLENWDSLLAGNTLSFRFAVLKKRRSYGFELKNIDSPAGTTAFEMVPTNRLIALGVPAARLVFDEDRNILRYAGLVPPLEEVGRRLKRLDATVTYEHMSEVYR